MIFQVSSTSATSRYPNRPSSIVHRLLWLLPILLVFLAIASPSLAQKRSKKIQPPQLGKITIDQYVQPLELWPEVNRFRSTGPVRIVLEDSLTGVKTTLLADDAEGMLNGDIKVRGAVQLLRSEGVMKGTGLNYNADTQTGSVLQARVDMSNLFIRGDKIELLPGQVIRATNASFTTCIRGRPDYHITARELSVDANRRVKAKNVTFWIGRTRIISLPSLTRSFKQSQGTPIPLPSYSKESFIQLRFRDVVIAEPQTSFDYNIIVSARRTPEGTAAYEHDIGRVNEDDTPPRTRVNTLGDPLKTALLITPPPTLRSFSDSGETHRRTTMYALATASSFVYNRKRTDLRVSRLPEIGLRLWNMNGRSIEGDGNSTDPLGRFFYAGDWLINIEGGLGYFQERPTGAKSARIGMQATVASPLFPIAGGLHARYGFTGWSSAYERGKAYSLISPEFELDYLLGHSVLIGAAYSYFREFGATPFVFDHKDVTHEARLRYGYLGGRWAYDFNMFFDLERHRSYDSQLSVRKRFDCMEVGIGYSQRSQGISLILNLLPPTPNKTAPNAVK